MADTNIKTINVSQSFYFTLLQNSSSDNTDTNTSNTADNQTASSSDPDNSQQNSNTTHTHSFSAATCTEPKKCSCYEPEGGPTGCEVCRHYGSETNEGDMECHCEKSSVCGARCPFGGNPNYHTGISGRHG